MKKKKKKKWTQAKKGLGNVRLEAAGCGLPNPFKDTASVDLNGAKATSNEKSFVHFSFSFFLLFFFFFFIRFRSRWVRCPLLSHVSTFCTFILVSFHQLLSAFLLLLLLLFLLVLLLSQIGIVHCIVCVAFSDQSIQLELN